MAVAHWLEVLDRDAQVGVEELLEEELERWLDPDRGIGYVEESPPVTTKERYTNRNNYENINMIEQFYQS